MVHSAMLAEKQIDNLGILALASTIINLEVNINSKTILSPMYIFKKCSEGKNKTLV